MSFYAIYPENGNPIYEVNDFETFLKDECNFDR